MATRGHAEIEFHHEVEVFPTKKSGCFEFAENLDERKHFWPGDHVLTDHSREDAERALERTLLDLRRDLRRLALIDFLEQERAEHRLAAREERNRKAAATRAKNRDPWGQNAAIARYAAENL